MSAAISDAFSGAISLNVPTEEDEDEDEAAVVVKTKRTASKKTPRARKRKQGSNSPSTANEGSSRRLKKGTSASSSCSKEVHAIVGPTATPSRASTEEEIPSARSGGTTASSAQGQLTTEPPASTALTKDVESGRSTEPAPAPPNPESSEASAHPLWAHKEAPESTACGDSTSSVSKGFADGTYLGSSSQQDAVHDPISASTGGDAELSSDDMADDPGATISTLGAPAAPSTPGRPGVPAPF